MMAPNAVRMESEGRLPPVRLGSKVTVTDDLRSSLDDFMEVRRDGLAGEGPSVEGGSNRARGRPQPALDGGQSCLPSRR